MIKILVVEDDEGIRSLLNISLVKNGYYVEVADDGAKAVDMIEYGSYDLIILDIMLPEIDGYTLFEYIEEYHIPTIFLTAKATVEDKVKGLRMGAEDYIVKPFDILELIARIETVLRRYHKQDRYLRLDNILIDTEAHTVTRNGVEIELTLKEYELLSLFVRNRGIVLYRETIYERVWNEMYLAGTRTVDLHVQRLRKKMGLEDRIKSVPKVGYRLE